MIELLAILDWLGANRERRKKKKKKKGEEEKKARCSLIIACPLH
jgi:hypothetical protein